MGVTILKMMFETSMDHNIEMVWDCNFTWIEHIKNLDPNIIKVSFDAAIGYTDIYFISEEHKTWFILRWS
jgi:hypothetical protein